MSTFTDGDGLPPGSGGAAGFHWTMVPAQQHTTQHSQSAAVAAVATLNPKP